MRPLLLALLIAGCPAPRSPAPELPTPEAAPTPAAAEEAVEVGEAWDTGPARAVVEPQDGFTLRLPDEWGARRGQGDTLLEIRSPVIEGISARLRRWDGDAEALRGLIAGRSQGFVSEGPFEELAGVDELWVATWGEGDDRQLHLGWYLRGVRGTHALEADIPRVGFVTAMERVQELVRSLRPVEESP